jgi:diguanylate cyclase (GGDEF)-like protein
MWRPSHAAAFSGGPMRIRGKLIASYSLLVLLILLAFAIIVYTTFAEYIKHDRDGYFNMKGRSVFQKLTSAVHGHMQDMELFSVRNGLGQLTTGRTPAEKEELTGKLASYLASHGPLTSMALVAPDGTLIAAAGTDSKILPVARRITALLKNRKGDFKPGVFAQEDEVFITCPLAKGATGELAGLLLARLDTDSLRNIISAEAAQKDALFLVSKEGVLLFSCCTLPDNVNADMIRGIVRNVTNNAGPAVVRGVSLFRNLYVFSNSSPILGWDLSYVVPGKAYSRELITLRNRMIAAILIITLIAAWVIIIVSYRISRPIVALSQASKNIIEFDYTSSLDIARTGDEIGELAHNFETMRRKIKDLVITDHLTGIYNRRFLMKTLESEISRAERLQHELTCLLMDVDHFKQINDANGHLCGDEVLKRLGQLLRETVREYDVVARYGGEEFFVLLPNTALQTGYEIAERIRQEVGELAVLCGEKEVRVSVSIGVASREGPACTPEIILNRADTALYRAKNAGRNRTEVYGA